MDMEFRIFLLRFSNISLVFTNMLEEQNKQKKNLFIQKKYSKVIFRNAMKAIR